MKTPNPIVLGQAPARMTESHKAFDAASARRVASLMGLPTVLHLHHLFDLHNVMDWSPADTLNLDTLPTADAQAAARHCIPDLKGRVVLILGRDVANLFSLSWIDWLTWSCAFGAKVAVAPHPSPQNRWWSRPDSLRATKEFLHAFADDALHGRMDQCLSGPQWP